MRKDDEKYLPPSRKRNKGWMKMYTGQTVRANSGARQGKRIGGTIIGSMSAFVYMPVG